MFIEHINHKTIRFTLDKYDFEDVLVEVATLQKTLQRSYLMKPEHKRAIEDMLQDAQDRAKGMDLP